VKTPTVSLRHTSTKPLLSESRLSCSTTCDPDRLLVIEKMEAATTRARHLALTAASPAHRRRVVMMSRSDISQCETPELGPLRDADLSELSRIVGGSNLTCATWNRIAATWTPELASPKPAYLPVPERIEPWNCSTT
jgi:hypothetical protein